MRYRRISTCLWSDAKFNRLSRLPACGQALWLYLLTGPHTTNIPGLFRVTRAGLAEELGWELDELLVAFGELEAQGMARADWKAKLVWIPNALRHNPPQSVNVVRSWATRFDELPECRLLVEAWDAICDELKAVGEAFEKAFREICRRPTLPGDTPSDLASDMPSGMPSGKASGMPSGMASGMVSGMPSGKASGNGSFPPLVPPGSPPSDSPLSYPPIIPPILQTPLRVLAHTHPPKGGQRARRPRSTTASTSSGGRTRGRWANGQPSGPGKRFDRVPSWSGR